MRPRPPMSATEGRRQRTGGEPRAHRRRQLAGPRGARRGAGRHRPLVQQHALDHDRLPVRRADDRGVGHAGLDAPLPAVVDDLVPAGPDAQAERLRCGTVTGRHGADVDLGPGLAGVVDHDPFGGDQRGPVVAGIGTVLGRGRGGAGRGRFPVREHPPGAGARRPERQGQALGAERAVVLLEPLGDDPARAHPEGGGHLVGSGDVGAEIDTHDRPGRNGEALEPHGLPAPVLGDERGVDGGGARERVEQDHDLPSVPGRGSPREVPGRGGKVEHGPASSPCRRTRDARRRRHPRRPRRVRRPAAPGRCPPAARQPAPPPGLRPARRRGQRPRPRRAAPPAGWPRRPRPCTR